MNSSAKEILFAQLEERIQYQRRKVQMIANQINPKLTADDILQPHDFPELANHPEWNYEDGILAGLVLAQVLLHRELNFE